MEIRRSVLVSHRAEQMFDLIEAAEHYPAFLPWCADARIVARDDTEVVADILVAWHGVRFGFTTRNPKRRPEWMAVTLERGPFRHFAGEWQLAPLGEVGCRVNFTLTYDFESGVMRTVASPVFERITSTLVDAFVARADRVYVPPAMPGPDAGPPRSLT
jgi:ribosome-associated toxin RatA of RatAB toxin-antitoxin module